MYIYLRIADSVNRRICERKRNNEAIKMKLSNKSSGHFLHRRTYWGHILGFLCYTSCVPEGKHVGQKDDTRENSCVIVKVRARKKKRERGKREKGGRKRGEKEKIRKTERAWLDRKRKATHILVSISLNSYIFACVHLHTIHMSSATKCV